MIFCCCPLAESDEAFCGNKITELGEECDCGYEDECGSSKSCCVGRPSDSGTINISSACKLLPGKQCRSVEQLAS